MSHQIDYKCHEMAERWNGHLAYSDRAWKLMRGKLPYLLNRRVHSDHMAIFQRLGLRVINQIPVIRHDGLRRSELAPRFRGIEDSDLETAGVLVQLMKP